MSEHARELAHDVGALELKKLVAGFLSNLVKVFGFGQGFGQLGRALSHEKIDRHHMKDHGKKQTRQQKDLRSILEPYALERPRLRLIRTHLELLQ